MKKEKRGELLWAIASKKNFTNLYSAAFVAVFECNLVHAYKFRIFQKTMWYKYPAGFKNIENKEGF